MKTIKGIILLTLTILWGCSNANENTIALNAEGKHPTGWTVASNGGQHPAAYLNSPEKCNECHGANLTGGISKVSCFSADRNGMTCHAQGPLGHPAGWSAATAHGAHAKAAATGADGMAFCTNCHGADYRGKGLTQKDCQRCHINAPHPNAWRSTGLVTHTNTHPSNAVACAQCHTNQANLAVPLPAFAFTADTSGCFNNTLCHGPMRHELPFSGSAHRPGGTGVLQADIPPPYSNCINCHDTTTVGGLFPVASGTAPLCSACHININRLNTTPGCWDCHGSSATDGRPNGASFPNRQGEHNRSEHSVACTVCHPITSGSVSHGWSSNQAKSSNATVEPALNWVPGSRNAGAGTCDPSAGGFTGCHDFKTGWY